MKFAGAQIQSLCNPPPLTPRAEALFIARERELHARTDRLFAALLLAEWFIAVAVALWVSPWSWSGSSSEVHAHVRLAIVLGGAIVLPALLDDIVGAGGGIVAAQLRLRRIADRPIEAGFHARSSG